jgi:hypothetical protein
LLIEQGQILNGTLQVTLFINNSDYIKIVIVVSFETQLINVAHLPKLTQLSVSLTKIEG